MRRAAALGLVVGIAALVRRVGPPGALDERAAGLAFGMALIAATLAGGLFEKAGLPRISGYLAFGLVCGPYLGDLISSAMARQLQLVNGLAIALIAFVAGLELNLGRLRPRLRAILNVAVLTLGTLAAGLLAVLWLAWPWLPIEPGATGLHRLALAALLMLLVVSFSPTVTIAVIAESRARGPLCELVLALVVIADLFLILAFTLLMQAVRWTSGSPLAADVGLLARLSWEIPGSLAFGAVAGAAFALYLRHVGRELTVVLLALCVLLTEVGHRLHFEPLLAALAAGLVVENVAPPAGDALHDAIARGSLPVLVVFFVAAGASLHLDAIATIGVVALAVSLLRIVMVRASTRAAARAAGIEPNLGRLLWMGLVSQAGVTLGLTIIVAAEFPGWGLRVQTLMVALIALHELLGPILFRAALARAGEVGAAERAAVPP